jgi:hypothetical protein
MTLFQPPYAESFSGRLVEIMPGRPALLLAGRGRLPPRTRLIARDSLLIAFGFHFLMSPEFLLPQLVIDDFRREFHGRAAIEFMLRKGNSYPRADTVGMRLPDRERADLYMKEVDIAAGLQAFAFAGEFASPPLAQLAAAAWLDAATRPDAGILDVAEVDGSLLGFSVHCYRCNPALAAALLERVRGETKP